MQNEISRIREETERLERVGRVLDRIAASGRKADDLSDDEIVALLEEDANA